MPPRVSSRRRRSAMRGIGAGAAVLGLAAALLTGCTAGGQEGRPAPAVPGFDDVYGQTVAWAACPVDADADDDPVFAQALVDAGRDSGALQCASIRVPLDWHDPDRADRIELALTRLPAEGERVGTIIQNPGGPGSAGRWLPARTAGSGRADELVRSYDLLGFDPRGVGASTPISCGEASDLPLLRMAQCADRSEIVHFMGTESVVKDIDVMRVLSGDAKLNFLGTSYGTFLGATYADMFPALVGHVVLDSALDTVWSDPLGLFEQLVARVDAVLDGVEVCRAYSSPAWECAFETRADLLAYIDSLRDAPLVGTDGTRVTADEAVDYLAQTLGDGPFARFGAVRVLSEASRGNRFAIDVLADSVIAPDIAHRTANTVVTCFSLTDPIDVLRLADAVAGVDPAVFLGQDADGLVATLVDEVASCPMLAETGTEVPGTWVAEGSAPLLVIGITGDHATAYAGAERMTAGLDHATLLTLDGWGHGASFAQSACVDAAVTAYFLTDALPAEGTVCEPDPLPAPPVVTSIVADGASMTLSGTAVPGATVRVVTTDVTAYPVADVADADGAWGPVEIRTGCVFVVARVKEWQGEAATACAP